MIAHLQRAPFDMAKTCFGQPRGGELDIFKDGEFDSGCRENGSATAPPPWDLALSALSHIMKIKIPG